MTKSKKGRISVSLQSYKLIPGTCFLCVGSCDVAAYLHHQCAQAYFDEKERLRKKINEEHENGTA